MYRLLLDTCVWLDIAKDPQQHALLSVLEQLVESEEVSLITPRIVVNEFNRNKARIINEGTRSLASHFKQVKDAVKIHGNPVTRETLINDLNDLDQQLDLLNDSGLTASAVRKIEFLLSRSVIEGSPAVILKSAQRAIDGRAPFHRSKNSMGDAIILETYAEEVSARSSIGHRFAFVTHNISDFSLMDGNRNYPHPDLAPIFTKRKSLYFISLSKALSIVSPELITETMYHNELMDRPRPFSEMVVAMNEITDKIWYNRHHNWLRKISVGEERIVESSDFTGETNTTPKSILLGALKSAKIMEDRYGLDKLGPWDDFEWGMLNGKLSSLRWMLGEEWDSLDT